MLETKHWSARVGASPGVLEQLVAAAPFELPQAYLEFLAASNGGEGPLSEQPCWLILDSAEDVYETEINQTFHVDFPTLFVIGGNGASELFAFAKDNSGALKVVYFDMYNVDLETSVVEIAPSFDTLMAYLEPATT
ncbi:SMI1/KNR4 family protein [uncultured Shimia sp.]|uniref:SMI1/KNR4 family protein n=1 Tax=uncultured Shimia sp. TaxID=573152 RepID=UPI0026351BB3|nr:SMI1/KNR4 family protein [uncultured Shimia sp.]